MNQPHLMSVEIPAAWVGFVDIYGFSALLRHRDAPDTLLKLEKYQAEVTSQLREIRDVHFFVFSDSVVFALASQPPHLNAFKEVHGIIKKMYFQALGIDFMLRGTVTFGPVRASKHYILGEAMLRAIEVEKELALPLVCAPAADLKSANILDENGVSTELLRTKRGLLKGMDLASMPFDLVSATVDKYLDETSIYGPQEVALVWAELRDRIKRGAKLVGVPQDGPRRITDTV